MATKASKTETTNAVAVQSENAGAVVDPSTLAGFADFAGQGMQGLSKDDLAIPFLSILQSGSPQCKRSEGEYIEGAAEGMLFNTVTKTVIDPIKTPVIVIPCSYNRALIEWRVREAGGGFVKEHPVDEALLGTTVRDDKGRDILPNGNQLNDTRSFYVMVLDPDTGIPAPAFMTMTSTQIKKAKQWLMQQNLLKLPAAGGRVYTPPMFASKWRVTTVPEQNDKGSWMGWAFEHAGYLSGPQDPIFQAALEFHQSVSAGAVKMDMARAADVVDGTTREPGMDDEGGDAGASF
jgi:hypothetical protein